VTDRVTGCAVPDKRRLTLVSDADGGYIFVAKGCPSKGISRDTNLAGPDFIRIMFDPSGLRKKLGKFLLGHGNHFTRVCDYQRSRAGSTLV
jgi:hypothetical protein